MENLPLLLSILAFATTIGSWAIYGNWIYLDKGGFTPPQIPSYTQFYWLGLRNLGRILLLRKPLSINAAYPHLLNAVKPRRMTVTLPYSR
jgi:hypothetical protein